MGVEQFVDRDELLTHQRYLIDQGLMARFRGWREAGELTLMNFSTSQLLGVDAATQIERRLVEQPDSVVLEIGAGEANALADLQAMFPGIKPIAIDLLPLVEPGRMTSIAGDAMALPLVNESADVAYSTMTFCYVPDKIKALTEVWRVLKPGGLAVIHMGGEAGTQPSLEDCIVAAELQDIFRLGESEFSEFTQARDVVVRITKPKSRHESLPDWGLEFLGMELSPFDDESCRLPMASAISHYRTK